MVRNNIFTKILNIIGLTNFFFTVAMKFKKSLEVLDPKKSK